MWRNEVESKMLLVGNFKLLAINRLDRDGID
jgi:hypothetical protein